MKKLSKKVLTLLLAVSMVFGLSGITAFAAEADDATGEDGIEINVTYDDGTTESMTLADSDIDAAIADAAEQTFTAVNPMGMTMRTETANFVLITDLLSEYLGLDDVESITIGGYTSGEEYTSPMNTPFSYELDNAWLFREDSGYSFAVDGGLMLLWNVGTVSEIAVVASAAEEPGEEEGSIPVYRDGEQVGELLLSDIAAAFEDSEMYEIKDMTSTSPMGSGVMNEYNNLKVVNIAKLLDVYLGVSADEISELNLSLECTRQSAMSGDFTFSPEEAYLYEYNPSGYDNPYGLAVDGALQPRWYSIVTGIGILSTEPEASEYITVSVGDNEYQLSNSDIDAAIAAAPEQTFDRVTPMGSGGTMTAQYVLIKDLLEDCLGLTDITEITVSRGDVSFTSGEDYYAMGMGPYTFDMDNAWLYAAEDGGYAFAVNGGLMMFWVSMSSVDTITAVATEPVEEEGIVINVTYDDGTTDSMTLANSNIDAAIAVAEEQTFTAVNPMGMIMGTYNEKFVRITDLLSEYLGLDNVESITVGGYTSGEEYTSPMNTPFSYDLDNAWLYRTDNGYSFAVDGGLMLLWNVGTVNEIAVTASSESEPGEEGDYITVVLGDETYHLMYSDIAEAVANAPEQTFEVYYPFSPDSNPDYITTKYVLITDLLSEYLGIEDVERLEVADASGASFTSGVYEPFGSTTYGFEVDNAWLYFDEWTDSAGQYESGYYFAVDGGLRPLWAWLDAITTITVNGDVSGQEPEPERSSISVTVKSSDGSETELALAYSDIADAIAAAPEQTFNRYMPYDTNKENPQPKTDKYVLITDLLSEYLGVEDVTKITVSDGETEFVSGEEYTSPMNTPFGFTVDNAWLYTVDNTGYYFAVDDGMMPLWMWLTDIISIEVEGEIAEPAEEEGIAIDVTYTDGTTDSMTLANSDIGAAIAVAEEQTFTAVNPMGMIMRTETANFVRITDLLSEYLGLDNVESITVGGYTSGEEYTSPMNTPFSYDLDNAWLYRTDNGYSFAVDGGLMLLWNVGTVNEIAVVASTEEEPVAADKSELEKAIADAEELNPEDYTEESWSAVDAALAAAIAVMDDPDATQEDVDEALRTLDNAIDNLEPIPTPTPTPGVDKEVLESAINDAVALNENDYTPDTWAALQTALEAAQKVDADEDASQDDVNAATIELVSALANLQFAEEPPAEQPDKTDLLNEYVEGMKLDESSYTPESWEPFAQALADAQSVLTNPDATQDDVEAAEEALKIAMDNLAENGPVKNGLCRIEAGKLWGYYVDGVVDETYTGFASNENGDWWVVDGYVKFDVNSVEKDPTGKYGDKGVSDKGTWWYVIGNKVQHDFTGLANYKNANGWWYIVDGKVDFSHNGVDKNKNGWYYVMNGKVRFDFTGLSNYRNDNGWWYISGGKVMFDHNGVEKNQNGWYYVKNSKVDFTFNGIASNKNGSWYITNGRVNFSYSGTVTYNGNRYTVKGGKVS